MKSYHPISLLFKELCVSLKETQCIHFLLCFRILFTVLATNWVKVYSRSFNCGSYAYFLSKF